jgi:hypothetical protein
MPAHTPLGGRIGALIVAAALLAGCAQPGTQAPKPQAAKLAVGTSDISTACGYLEEREGFGRPSQQNLASLESMAEDGARRLAAVYAKDQTGIYQGDSIGALLGDSISLLHDCGLPKAEKTLKQALAAHR